MCVCGARVCLPVCLSLARKFGGSHQFVTALQTKTNVVVTSVPLQWACVNVPCECTFVQNVTLAPGAHALCASSVFVWFALCECVFMCVTAADRRDVDIRHGNN